MLPEVLTVIPSVAERAADRVTTPSPARPTLPRSAAVIGCAGSRAQRLRGFIDACA
jgi:hypothetical protein